MIQAKRVNALAAGSNADHGYVSPTLTRRLSMCASGAIERICKSHGLVGAFFCFGIDFLLVDWRERKAVNAHEYRSVPTDYLLFESL